MPKVKIGAVIAAYNRKKGPNDKPMTSVRLANYLRTTRQTLVNYQNGRVPSLLLQLLKLSAISGLTINEIIEVTLEEKNELLNSDLNGRK